MAMRSASASAAFSARVQRLASYQAKGRSRKLRMTVPRYASIPVSLEYLPVLRTVSMMICRRRGSAAATAHWRSLLVRFWLLLSRMGPAMSQTTAAMNSRVVATDIACVLLKAPMRARSAKIRERQTNSEFELEQRLMTEAAGFDGR